MIRSYAEFETALLLAAYCIAERGQNDFVPMKVILQTYALDGQPHWLERAFAGNIQSGAFNDIRTAGPATDQEAWLTPAGARRAEDLMRSLGEPPRGRSIYLSSSDEQHPFAANSLGVAQGRSDRHSFDPPEIPASDRMVTLDHNSFELASISSKSEELIAQLHQANDLGSMSPEEAAIAADEVDLLKNSFKNDVVRQNTILQMASRTLTWIAGKAGEALVGALAVGLMALIFSYFGIVIPL